MQIQWPKLAESTRYPEITLSCTSFRTAKVRRESTTIIIIPKAESCGIKPVSWSWTMRTGKTMESAV